MTEIVFELKNIARKTRNYSLKNAPVLYRKYVALLRDSECDFCSPCHSYLSVTSSWLSEISRDLPDFESKFYVTNDVFF